VTRPLQKYELVKHADRLQPAQCATDATSAAAPWWRPVAEHELSPGDDDKSLPAAVSFAWEMADPCSANGGCDLFLSRDPEFTSPQIIRGVLGGHCEVFHLHVGTRYYWKVAAQEADGRLVESEVRSFVTHAALPRWIRVPDLTNVRDMGGWPIPGRHRVRQGMLYRSCEMNNKIHIKPEGVDVLVKELKIRTDLDVRGIPWDDAAKVQAALDPAVVEWVHLPVAPYELIAEANWRGSWWVKVAYEPADDPDWRGNCRRVFELLAEKHRYPILLHCRGGADRTGTLAFLIQGLLGVKLPHLVHDYELTSLSLQGERWATGDWFQPLLRTLRPFAKRKQDIQGQVEGLLRSAGVTDEVMASIRAHLTEPRKGCLC
jgi:protein-tyrosine phosphatase